MPSHKNLVTQLRALDMTEEEAIIYIALLKAPSTHLRLSHTTGINRTKVYRIANDLEKRSLIARRTDDRGVFLVAADPSTLEVDVVTKEEQLKHQQAVYNRLLPTLASLRVDDGNAFIVRTYEGEEGLRQMLWHELETKGELVIFGSGTTEDLLSDAPRWAEMHRALHAQKGYTMRELINGGPGDHTPDFTKHEAFLTLYRHRLIPAEVLPFNNQTSIYNDVVATYHWRQNQKVGVEIINKDHARMMRRIFETYWAMATPQKPNDT